MEQQDFTPIGGNWQQDAAYSLRQIIQQASELLQKFDENGQLITSAITQNNSTVIDAINEKDTVVELTVYRHINNRETIYIAEPPIIKEKPQQKIIQRIVTVTPPPIVVNVSRVPAYLRVCGSRYSTMDSRMVECRRCVDNWLDARPEGFRMVDVTHQITGCGIKATRNSPHFAVSSRCNPPTNITDRAAVHAYRECMKQYK